MTKKGQPNNRLQTERRRRGWTQVYLAELMNEAARDNGLPLPSGLDGNYISRYERGISQPSAHHVHLLCLAFDLPSDRLGLPGESAPVAATMGVGGEDDTNRQEFIRYGLGAVATVLAPGAGVDWERLAFGLGTLRQADARMVDDLAAISQDMGRRAHSVSPDAILPALKGHTRALQLLLGRSHPSEIVQRLQSLASRMTQLSAWLSYQSGRPTDAYADFAIAEALARDAGNGRLLSLTLGARSRLYSRVPDSGLKADRARCLALLNEAEASARGTAGNLVRFWIFTLRAEEHAAAGDAVVSYRDLDTAESLLTTAPSSPDEFFNFGSFWLPGSRGKCAILLGDGADAITPLNAALQLIEPSLISDRCLLLTDLAVGHVEQTREIEQACTLLAEACAISAQAGLETRMRRIWAARRRHFEEYKGSTAVRQLDEYMLTVRDRLSLGDSGSPSL